ncbi:heme peroxidase [Schizophyllum amplum]|uniref:Heme peroxidase n=1 Tax=Schizophyllum amplum TaxID=97359 RepID=A0A550CL74_9AGAR|nr:heme peroxidase [Auriculariopsis ampla]
MESLKRRLSGVNDLKKGSTTTGNATTANATTNGPSANGSSTNASAAAGTSNGKYSAYIAATDQEPSIYREAKLFGGYQEPSTIAAAADFIRHKESLDDRKMLLEHGLNFIANVKSQSFQKAAQNEVIKMLYNDLPHPPATSLGNEYAWRKADGSYNNPDLPQLGKAGVPYSRSVAQTHPLPAHLLPDPGLIFDTVFRTNHQDVNINETSSYVDLSPLYGHDQATQDKVRDKKGFGMLHKDAFAEDRLLLLPPATCAILVCFSRNHNYIATKLLEINERQRWVDPSELVDDEKALMEQDEEIFQTARLINCGWFGSAVFADYVHCILGLVRQGSSWTLDPFSELRLEDHSVFERGKGNACSVEFNCLYRWHATTSVHDEAWVEKVMAKEFPDKKAEEITSNDFKMCAVKMMKEVGPDLTHWTFGNMQRQEDGSFKDEQLADILHNATETPAGAFRARGTPAVMRLHETMGIEQNRKWGVCSMNDFRRFLGLKPYATFLEWNSDPEIANAAKTLYGDIERLELYVGLQAEEAKPVVEGAGLCPGYTISRAILSDAVALTRGDRFFTHDFTPFNLTAWGFADCQRDDDAHGFGSVLARLFLRTLPGQFTEDSVYGFFPLMTPQAMGVVPAGYRGKEQQAKIAKIFQARDIAPGIVEYFKTTTEHLLSLHGCPLPGTRSYVIDIVRDVLRPLPALWVANELAGIQLKETTQSDGVYTVDEFYSMLAEIYEFIYLDIEPARVKTIECRVRKHVEELLGHISSHLNNTFPQKVIGAIMSKMPWAKPAKKSEHDELVRRLQQLAPSSSALADTILAIMVSVVDISLALTNVVNAYLGPHKRDEPCPPHVDAFAKAAKPQDLEGYILEALRHDPPVRCMQRVAVQNQIVENIHVKETGRVYLDVLAANEDEAVFPSASEDKYVLIDGSTSLLGQDLAMKIYAEVIGVIFSHDNVKRTIGQSGLLQRFRAHDRKALHYAYLDKNMVTSPWPVSMMMQFDA